ncbi:ABC transporter ATP-binding protein [Geobacillus sp. C56-T2]|uniref:ABC transporter ATP-binding protein n=1 Tax=Geobacillus sp. C56-T2 TaxID=600773 RepID=UPI00119D3260|nr:sn-glycerol-3-phosphate ABC transporter ATP-binding protein UgpC [Geobacillus sp. C56-T2]NNV06864.1 sn-glycerol-3-phosphate ABC transporter ATP-binding protein UgpC [Geobacillus sp. MMMUD3]TWG30788.1 sn-glycerol 3-phosphate transport system ATP-binding protein [Geobacillus sp. C56-T2]
MAFLELIDVTKSYDGKKQVVENVSVAIESGEFFVLVGPSGCGKSTLLRLIAGLESLTSGYILIDGQVANDWPPHARRLSMVFQNYALYPHLTVEQNMRIVLQAQKVPKEEQRRRCLEAAEMLGLTDVLGRKPRELSGGQRQRVALGRAIVARTPLCLMDEPLSNLDAKLRATMRVELRRLQRQLGMTVIYVTHDQTEAMTMADRVMILRAGHPQQVGAPLDIYNHPANTFVASFVGTPPMNLAEAHVLEHSLLLQNERPVRLMRRPLPKTERVTIGLRPEHIHRAALGDGHVTASIVHVERLGSETLVTFELTKQIHWTARWSGQANVAVGEVASFSFDEHALHFFDGHSKRIGPPTRREEEAFER